MPGQAEFTYATLDRGNDLIGDVLMDVEALFLARGSAIQEGEQRRLQIAPRGCALACRPAVVSQFE